MTLPCLLPFERVEADGLEQPALADSDFPDFFWSVARARLRRGESVAAQWGLARLSASSGRAHVFAFPGPDPQHPPVSLWLANLRELALASGWCGRADLWGEVAHTGWGSYEFNCVRDWSFSPTGGALEGKLFSSWDAYCGSSELSPDLLCALPWDGLAGMWGAGWTRARALRESRSISEALGFFPGAEPKSGRSGRVRKA